MCPSYCYFLTYRGLVAASGAGIVVATFLAVTVTPLTVGAKYCKVVGWCLIKAVGYVVTKRVNRHGVSDGCKNTVQIDEEGKGPCISQSHKPTAFSMTN